MFFLLIYRYWVLWMYKKKSILWWTAKFNNFSLFKGKDYFWTQYALVSQALFYFITVLLNYQKYWTFSWLSYYFQIHQIKQHDQVILYWFNCWASLWELIKIIMTPVIRTMCEVKVSERSMTDFQKNKRSWLRVWNEITPQSFSNCRHLSAPTLTLLTGGVKSIDHLVIMVSVRVGHIRQRVSSCFFKWKCWQQEKWRIV